MDADYHQTVIDFNTKRGFHQTVTFCLNPHMDTKAEIRRKRLVQLIQDRFGGNQTEFAEQVGRRQSAVSDMVRGAKSFGEKIARDIELRLGLPELWLDGADSEKDVEPPVSGKTDEYYIVAKSPEDLVRQLRDRGDDEIMGILQLLVANKDKFSGH